MNALDNVKEFELISLAELVAMTPEELEARDIRVDKTLGDDPTIANLRAVLQPRPYHPNRNLSTGDTMSRPPDFCNSVGEPEGSISKVIPGLPKWFPPGPYPVAFDHGGTTYPETIHPSVNGQECAVFDPYGWCQKWALEVAEWCREHGLNCYVTPNSEYNPSKTFRILIY